MPLSTLSFPLMSDIVSVLTVLNRHLAEDLYRLGPALTPHSDAPAAAPVRSAVEPVQHAVDSPEESLNDIRSDIVCFHPIPGAQEDRFPDHVAPIGDCVQRIVNVRHLSVGHVNRLDHGRFDSLDQSGNVVHSLPGGQFNGPVPAVTLAVAGLLTGPAKRHVLTGVPLAHVFGNPLDAEDLADLALDIHWSPTIPALISGSDSPFRFLVPTQQTVVPPDASVKGH